MIAAVSAVVVVALGFAAYYVKLHIEWRREVRRRRAERERERERQGYRTYSLDPGGNVDVLDGAR